VEKIASKEQPSSDIKALNFGLFQNSEGHYSVYLVGSKEYDPDDQNWACNEDFVPADKYFHAKHKSVSSLKWQEFLKLVKNTLKKVLESENLKNSFFQNFNISRLDSMMEI
jgi:hypothetical protein